MTYQEDMYALFRFLSLNTHSYRGKKSNLRLSVFIETMRPHQTPPEKCIHYFLFLLYTMRKSGETRMFDYIATTGPVTLGQCYMGLQDVFVDPHKFTLTIGDRKKRQVVFRILSHIEAIFPELDDLKYLGLEKKPEYSKSQHLMRVFLDSIWKGFNIRTSYNVYGDISQLFEYAQETAGKIGGSAD